MDKEELFDKLRSLAQMDRDAVAVYDEALEHVTDDEVKTRFVQFRGEHDLHASRLADEIDRLGGKKPELKVDLLGHMADWVTAIRGMRGTEGALHAMRTAENYHNRRYGEAVEWDVGDAGLAKTLRGFQDDEKHHLEYIEARLGARPATRR